MRLIECHIENFGKISSLKLSFLPGCTVILKENGWGKSTLAVFIKVMFYGFSNERSKDDLLNERKRYRPWQGGVYGGSVVFEADGKEYEMTRTFGLREKEDTFLLRDRRTGLLSEDFSKETGEELFSLDLKSFERTVFLSQNDCATEATDRIHAKINSMAEDRTDQTDFEIVKQRLGRMLNAMSPDRKTGSLYKMKEAIAQAEMEAAKNRYHCETDGKLRKESIRLKDEYEFLKKEQTMLIARKKEIRKEMESSIRLEQNLQVYAFTAEEEEQYRILNELLCEEEREEQEIFDVYKREPCFEKMRRQEKQDEPVKRPPYPVLFFVAGILIFIAGILSRNYQEIFGIAAMAAGGLTALVSLFMMREYERQFRMIRQELQIQQMMKELEETHEELTEKYRKYQWYLSQSRKKGPSMDETDERIEEILEAVEENLKQQKECEDLLEELEKEELKQTELLEELKQWKEQYEEEERKYRMLTLTKEYLIKAKSSFALRYMEPLRQGFKKYYEILHGGSGEEFYLDTEIVLTKKELAEKRKVETLSAGSRDLIGLCMRMALIDAMYREEKPFLIFDDPFVNLDEERLKRAKEFLNAISERYQILYLTCHESRDVQ